MQKLKGRFWGCIFYPESQNSWQVIEEKARQYGYPIAISPLHDKDIDENGNLKGAHRHAIIAFNNTTTEEHAERVLTDIFNGTKPILIGSPWSMYQYHTHENDSTKFRYSDSDRIFLNSFDINNYHIVTESETLSKQIECDLYVREVGILEYSDLVYSLLDNGDFDKYKFVTTHSIHYSQLLKSLRCKRNGVEVY